MAGLSQDGQLGKLTTPAGDNVLVLNRFDGVEGLSKLFEFHAEAMSEQANIDFNALLGRNVCVSLTTVDQLTRYFNGVLVDALWTGERYDLYTYRLVFKPWLWLLSLTSDCRIFSSMQVPDIIVKVFQDRGFSDFRKALTGSYPTLEYCVQYRETDLDFVCRLMEEYGIYYFFEHEQSKHTLVLADGSASHKPVDGLASVPFLPNVQGVRRDKQLIEEWTAVRNVQTGRYVLNDYYYCKAGASMLAEADDPGGYAHDKMEMYDFPGGYEDKSVGETLAKVQVQADQSVDKRFTAGGAAPSLFAGALMTLEQHPTGAENREYLMVRCSHIFGNQEYRSSGSGTSAGGGRPYAGKYELTPSDRKFRAPLITPKAVVHGVQSALVVGKQGEEIDVDDQGRIAVVFYWDRKKTASRRIRVSQQWAGGHSRGFVFIPRIGDEVLVQYIEGDPDRPVVVGSVYNSNNKIGVPMPSEKNVSAIISDSTKGHSGYHKIAFDDTAGSELMFVRAQKDLLVNILNDETRNIGNDVTKSVGNNETIKVGATYSLTAAQEIVLTVGMSSLTITPASITLSSPSITFNATATLSAMAPEMSFLADASFSVESAAIAITGPTVIQPALMVDGEIAWTGPPPGPV